MTLSSPHRVLAVALTLWVALFMGESEWIVLCPAHSATTGVGPAVTSGSAAHGGHHDAGVAAAAAAHEHRSSSASPAGPSAGGAHAGEHGGDDEAHRCACPGPGCSAPALAVVPTVADPLSRLVAIHTAATFSTLDRLEDAPDHLLPYATAPPVAPLAPAA